MPKPYPKEFREDVVRVARNREPGVMLEQIAADFGVHPITLSKWLRRADTDEGARPATASGESAELAEACKRIRLLEQENEVLRRAAAYLSQANLPKMMYPLVRELAAADAPHRVPVAVTCRVLRLTRQPYNRWLYRPVTDAELAEAYRADALFAAHRDDPEFGHRFLLDEARAAGQVMAERTGWRICRDNRWESVFGKRKGRGKNAKAGPPDDDRGRRSFTAPATNRRWLTDITEHATGEGKLYLCAVKDVYSGRIVGYSIDSRMKSSLTVSALESAVARRGQVAGCIVHSDRGSPFRATKYVAVLARHSLVGSMGRAGAAGNNAAMENFFALLQKNVLDRRSWANHQELRIAIVAWIERTYHRRRRQRRLARLTPVDYEPIMTPPAALAA
ncbi:IS3 family transposase [Streptomyces sp. SID8014]|uniref:IS3 family transposase n=1 Tax=Streptomyces sp. SID8014 TaxID=2706097 RepID=UPI0013BA3174|nr:IS3 family transposase [Streptomyces sp. SID8014]